MHGHASAEDLGPALIVGSGAYNFFIIIGICIGSIPSPQTRRVKHTGVFFLTIFVAVGAYIWLYIILEVVSEKKIEVWESFLTLAFFPIYILVAWCVDRHFFGLFGGKQMHHGSHACTPKNPTLDRISLFAHPFLSIHQSVTD
jgi:solute carrier family 8 (sodium/calcium exchanger)